MDWSKIKTVLIWIFAFVNLFLLSVYFDIYESKGILTGNEYTSLLGKKKAGLDSVYIDGYEYLDKKNVVSISSVEISTILLLL